MSLRKSRNGSKERYWREVFRQWDLSGLTRVEFCRRRDLTVTTFDFWRRELRRRDADPAVVSRPVAPALVPVTVIGMSAIEVVLRDGRSVRVPAGFDPACLRSVLSVLEGVEC